MSTVAFIHIRIIFYQSTCVGECILSSQVVSLPLQSVMEVANFCAATDTLIDQDEVNGACDNFGHTVVVTVCLSQCDLRIWLQYSLYL